MIQIQHKTKVFSSQFACARLFICFHSVDSNNLFNDDREKQSFVATSIQSSSTSIANSETSCRSALDAITNAINNHMKPTIIATNKRRKQIDRPFGESITSVDAYIKIQNKENTRKKKHQKKRL